MAARNNHQAIKKRAAILRVLNNCFSLILIKIKEAIPAWLCFSHCREIINY